MKNILFLFCLIILLSACEERKFKLKYVHENMVYIDKTELPQLDVHQLVYVPAYSDIYYESEKKKTFLTVILSLRNISFTDTIYFDKIDYYGSDGKPLQSYLEKILVLRPMESMEYIVRSSDIKGGAGANFVVSYMADSNLKNHPYIESVMIGNLDSYRFSFSSPGININE